MTGCRIPSAARQLGELEVVIVVGELHPGALHWSPTLLKSAAFLPVVGGLALGLVDPRTHDERVA
jgi:hypothetical protein